MGYSAVASIHHLVDQYRRYLKTSFRFLDKKLRDQFEAYVNGLGVVVKGPLVTLAQDYAPGATLEALIREKVLHPGLLGLQWPFGSHPLFAHQEKAARLGAAGKGFAVASGTGSGKTEAFLLPMMSELLRLREQNLGQSGVKAIILYPMNALALDQLKRLRELFQASACPLTFGLYTGDSADTVPELELPQAKTELTRREDIRKKPPDILLTNYKQLEFMLLRRSDRPLFGPALRYLVLDEMHSYRGALATEIACLIRRLKARCGLEPGRLIGVGTSATLDVQGDGGAGLAKFMSDLFGEAVETAAVVREDYAVKPASLSPWIPPLPELGKADLEALETDNADAVCALAERLTGRVCPSGGTVAERVTAVLNGNRIIELMEAAFGQNPVGVSEVAAILKAQVPERAQVGLERLEIEIEAYLLVGSAVAAETDKPVLRPKLHLFLHGVYDLAVCLDPRCKRLVPEGGATCPDCGSATRPVALCRTCGQDFFKVKDNTRDPEMPEGTGDYFSDEATAFLTYELHELEGREDQDGTDDSDGGPSAKKKKKSTASVKQDTVSVCPRCGRTLAEGQKCPDHDLGLPYLRWRWAAKKSPQKGILHTCPSCGDRYNSGDIVTPLRTPTAATVSTLMLHQLDLLKDKDRKLLVFADNRQEVAHQAGYTKDHHRLLALRRAMSKAVQNASRPEGIALQGELPNAVLDTHKELGLVKWQLTPVEREKWVEAFQIQGAVEFSDPLRRRSSLEGLGIAEVRYEFLESVKDYPEFASACAAAGLTQDRGLLLLRAILDLMRKKRAIGFDFFQEYIDPDKKGRYRLLEQEYEVHFPEYQRYPAAYVLGGKPSGTQGITVFVSSGRGARPAPQVLARKVLGGDEHKATEFLEATLPLLVREKSPVLIHVRDFYLPKQARGAGLRPLQIDPRVVMLRIPSAVWICSHCGTWKPYDLGCCPKSTCAGTMLLRKPDDDDYFVNLFLHTEAKRLKVEEHSAQIKPRERARRETDLKEGRLQALIATPTLEMGVDIGSLLTVALRGAPPSPSNYAQRVGRAGRRLRIGFAITFCAGGAHDRHAFDDPQWLVAGRFNPQRLKLENPKVVRRHAHSYVIESLERDLPGLMKDFLDDPEQPTRWKPELLSDMMTALKMKAGTLRKGILGLFIQDQALGLTQGFGDDWARDVVERFQSEFEARLEDWWQRVKRLNQEYEEHSKIGSNRRDERLARARKAAYYELTGDPDTANPFSLLATEGFLPSYQFPTDTFSLDPGINDTPILRRAANIALEEFAPGNFVYANGRKLRSIRVLYSSALGPTAPTGRASAETSGQLRPYSFCGNCGAAAKGVINQCGHCGAGMVSESTGVLFVTGFEAEEQLAIGSDEESRRRKFYDRREHMLTDGTREVEYYPYFGAPLELHRRASILLTNWGWTPSKRDEGDGFFLCADCGRHCPVNPADIKAAVEFKIWDEKHRKLGCQGKIESFTLGYEFETDCLVLYVDMPEDVKQDGRSKQSPELASLAESLLMGARELLEIEPNEMAAFARLASGPGQPAQIVIYETVAGGAGYLEALASRFPELGEKAMDRLFKHQCGGACYLCLKHFGNQHRHGLMNKYGIMRYLQNWADLEPVKSETLSVSRAAENLAAMAKARGEGPFATGRRPGNKGPESEIERKLLEALKNIAGLPVPECQKEFWRDGKLFTVADFAFVNEKIAVYCDGYMFHGDKGTLDLDAEKRNWLQTQGWLVLTYWGKRIAQDVDGCARKIEQAWKARQLNRPGVS